MIPAPGPGPDTNPRSRGLSGEALSLFGSASRHFQALLSLAGLEGKSAVALYVRLLVMLIAALLFAALGYIFVLLTVAFALGLLFGISWVWIALGLALVHLLVAFVCASHVRSHYRTPVFASTAAELRKDIASLARKDAP